MSESRDDQSPPRSRRDRRSARAADGGRRPPNYAARRLLVSAAAVVVITMAALAAWRWIGGDDDSGVVAADWDEFAIVDRVGGSLETFDSSGRTGVELAILDPIRQVEAGGDRLALITDDAIVLTDATDGGIVVFGLAESDVPTLDTTATPAVTTDPPLGPVLPTTTEPVTTTDASAIPTTTLAPGTTLDDPSGAIRIAIPVGAAVRRLPTDDQLLLAVGTNAGGNALIVRGDGEVIDVGALAGQSDPFLFLDTVTTNRAGTHVAIADARNFQTILVSVEESEPVFLADQPIAVGESLIATSQVVGRRAEIALYELDGRRRTSVSTELPVGAAFDDDRLTYVTGDARMFRLEPDDDEPTEVAALAVPGGATVTSVVPTAGGERLVLAGGTFETVVDLDGESKFSTTFASATTVGVPSFDAACLVVGDEADAHSLVRLDDGTTVADLGGDVVASSADRACSTVLASPTGDQHVLVTTEGEAPLGRLRDAYLAPDGRSVVVVTTTGTSQLVPIEDDGTAGEPIPLRSPTPDAIDVAFLDR